MYWYSSSFLKHETEATLNILRDIAFDNLDYTKMVPSFIGTIGESKSEMVLWFLDEHVI